MSASDNEQPARRQTESSATVTLTLTIGPALSTDEMLRFSGKAAEAGESPAARLAKLVRKDLESAAA